jgi:uncharacterized membrane protein
MMPMKHDDREDEALQILKRRLAKGEISSEEYNRLYELLVGEKEKGEKIIKEVHHH